MKAILKCIDSEIEEQVTLIVNGKELICFAGVCPYKIEIGKEYPVAFEMNVFEDYSVNPSDLKEKMSIRLGDGFQYTLNGRLQGNTVDCGIPFEDEILLSEFGYLDGEFVKFKVDRIDVEFL